MDYKDKKSTLTLVAAFLCLAFLENIFLTLYVRDVLLGALLITMALCIAFIVGILALCLLLFWRLKKERKSRKRSFIATALASLLLFATAPSFYTGIIIKQMDIDNAKTYCESMIPALEEYKTEHGKYPDYLNEVEDEEQRPFALRRQTDMYRHTEDGFCFIFSDGLT